MPPTVLLSHLPILCELPKGRPKVLAKSGTPGQLSCLILQSKIYTVANIASLNFGELRTYAASCL